MNFIKTTLQVLRCLFPSKLPVGAAHFDTWAKSIFSIYKLEDKPGNRHALASLIMHLGPTTAYKPKRYFSFAVMKSLANETAFETMQSLRKEEDAYINKHINGSALTEQAPTTITDDDVICTTEQAIN